jgi:hypothetical protein
MTTAKWKKEPEKHDYPAAADYLALIAPPGAVEKLVAALQDAPIVHKKAKDILRAAQLPILSPDDLHVRADLVKIAEGTELSPILLVRGDYAAGVPLQVADGYHRVCASYHLDVNTDIPAKLVAL